MPEPSKFEPKAIEKLLSALETGMPFAPAAASAGIHRRTIDHWRVKGEAAQAKIEAGEEEPSAEELEFADFAERLEESIAKGHAWLYKKWVEESAKPRGHGNWLPYERMLERRFREDYRRLGGIEMGGKDGGPVSVTIESAFDLSEGGEPVQGGPEAEPARASVE